MKRLTLTALSRNLLAITGCTRLGPKSVAVDRFDYGTPVAEGSLTMVTLPAR